MTIFFQASTFLFSLVCHPSVKVLKCVKAGGEFTKKDLAAIMQLVRAGITTLRSGDSRVPLEANCYRHLVKVHAEMIILTVDMPSILRRSVPLYVSASFLICFTTGDGTFRSLERFGHHVFQRLGGCRRFPPSIPRHGPFREPFAALFTMSLYLCIDCGHGGTKRLKINVLPI